MAGQLIQYRVERSQPPHEFTIVSAFGPMMCVGDTIRHPYAEIMLPWRVGETEIAAAKQKLAESLTAFTGEVAGSNPATRL